MESLAIMRLQTNDPRTTNQPTNQAQTKRKPEPGSKLKTKPKLDATSKPFMQRRIDNKMNKSFFLSRSFKWMFVLVWIFQHRF